LANEVASVAAAWTSVSVSQEVLPAPLASTWALSAVLAPLV